jgi:hypothetical protein
MATTINDAFTAIDDYMAKNGKGQSFLAKKFVDLFEGVDSPLNVKNGAMVAVVDKFKKLGKSIDSFDTTVNSMGMKVRILMAALKPTSFRLLNDSADRLSKKFDSYGKALKLPRLSASAARINIPFPKKIEDHLAKIDSNISVIRTTSVMMRNIMVGVSSLLAANFKEKILPSSGRDYNKTSRSIQIFSNNTNSSYSPDESTKKGFFGKLFGGIWSITKIVGGVYLLGKLKQYLDDTSTGRAIKGMLNSMFTTVLKKITSIVTSKEVWKTLGNSVLLLVDAAGSIADNIFKYVIEPISNKVKKVDWGKAVEYMGNKMTWIYSNILEPIITSISNSMKKDLDNGDWGSLATKVLGTGLLGGVLLKFTPGLSTLAGLFTSMSGVIGVPGVAVGVGLIAASTLLFNRMNALSDMWDDRSQTLLDESTILQNGAYQMSSNIKYYADEQKKIAKTIETSSGVEKEIAKWKEKEMELYENFEKEKQKHQLLEGNFKKVLREYPISEGLFRGSEGIKLQKSMDNFNALSEQFRQEKSFIKDMIESNRKVTKVQDAEIVIPDKKDSHLFAKGGGPFDLALKDVNKKVDTIIAVLSEGFSGLASITAQSGGAVAQAVVASAGASKQTPVTVIGGSNPIQRHRINTGRHIEFGQ